MEKFYVVEILAREIQAEEKIDVIDFYNDEGVILDWADHEDTLFLTEKEYEEFLEQARGL